MLYEKDILWIVEEGAPGSWQIEWAESRFQDISRLDMNIQEKQKQAG
jgi:hypothetical protein